MQKKVVFNGHIHCTIPLLTEMLKRIYNPFCRPVDQMPRGFEFSIDFLTRGHFHLDFSSFFRRSFLRIRRSFYRRSFHRIRRSFFRRSFHRIRRTFCQRCPRDRGENDVNRFETQNRERVCQRPPRCKHLTIQVPVGTTMHPLVMLVEEGEE